MTSFSDPLADPRISTIRDALAASDNEPQMDPEPSHDVTLAAVSVIVRLGTELDVLLIKRAETDGDPWSGHMAFPGGRRHLEDADLEETATRETEEETGLSLPEKSTLLGRLPPLQPSTFRLPPISIFPFVFAAPADASAEVASREVEEVHWIPLSAFLDPGSRSMTTIPLGNTSREFPCFRFGDRVVWGLTYRILLDFLELIEADWGTNP